MIRKILGIAASLMLAAGAPALAQGSWQRIAAIAPKPTGPGPAAGVGPIHVGPGVRLDLNILVDQFGYRPGDPKVAVIRSARRGFDAGRRFAPGLAYEVRRAEDGKPIFAGQRRRWKNGEVQESSGDLGWWFDFSALGAPGHYYVYDVARKVRSATFRIGQEVYRDALRAAVRVFYYQRSGIEKKSPYADPCWTDAAAYVGAGQDRAARDVRDPDNAATERDLGGGWFDAGDTNKYVTFAAQAVHQLLLAYLEAPAVFTDDFNIPESGNGIPDLIDEVKWETDWLKKMQNPDGSALLKVGARKHVWAAPPSSDTEPRYYVQSCSSSTIAAAGMLAHAAHVFGRFPPLAQEAEELKARAIRGFDAYRNQAQKQTDCDDVQVVAGDADRSLEEQDDLAAQAAIYLYAITGESRFHDYLKANYRRMYPYRDFGWSRYHPHIGESLLYYTTLPGADAELKATILRDKLADAQAGNDVYAMSDQDLYRNFLHPEQYHWGSNTIRMGYANANLDMNLRDLDPPNAPAYRARALETLHYLHGVNPFGLVYLSNMYRYGATYSANEIFHTWFAPRSPWSNAQTSQCGPAPGYVVGGPNARAAENGVPADLKPPVGQPAQKSYRDWNEGWPQASYVVTEPSNTFQSNYVKLLSGLSK